jgi:hypothetical protein
MIRHSQLFSSTEFRMGRYDHPPGHEHCNPAEETASEHSVNRVEFGSFTLEVAGSNGSCLRATCSVRILGRPIVADISN